MRALRRVGAARELQLAGVGGNRAAQDLHQRALAGAILADQGQHLAAAGCQRNAAQSLRGAEALADLRHPQQRVLHGRSVLFDGSRRFRVRSADQSACSGSSSFLISGSFMFSGVASASPVAIRFSTCWPAR